MRSIFLLLFTVCCTVSAFGQGTWDTAFTIPGIVPRHAYSQVQPKLHAGLRNTLLVSNAAMASGRNLGSLAQYENGSWTDLNAPAGTVTAVQCWRDRIYIAGTFEGDELATAHRLAVREGDQWRYLAYFDDAPASLVAMPDALYIGGPFDSVKGVYTRYLARWTGSGINALRPPIEGRTAQPGITSMTEYQGRLAIVGRFDSIGGHGSSGIACLDPTTGAWSWLGGAYIVDESNIVAIGDKLYSDPYSVWEGAWRALPRPPYTPQTYYHLAHFEGALVLASRFSGNRSVLVLRDSAWSEELDAGGECRSLIALDGRLYGLFNQRYGAQAFSSYELLEYSDKMGWGPLPLNAPGQGISGLVSGIASTSEGVYVSGEFGIHTADGGIARNLARWDGQGWHAMRDSMTPHLNIRSAGGELYVFDRSVLSLLRDGIASPIATFDKYPISDVYRIEDTLYVGLFSDYPLESDIMLFKGVQQNGAWQFTSASWTKGVRQILRDAEGRLVLVTQVGVVRQQGNTWSTIMRGEREIMLGTAVIDGQTMLVDRYDNFYQRPLARIDLRTRSVEYDSSGASLLGIVGGYVYGYVASDEQDTGVTLVMYKDGEWLPVAKNVITRGGGSTEWNGDLYLAGTIQIGQIQSAGIARFTPAFRNAVRTSVAHTLALQIAPNPASDEVNIFSPDLDGHLSIEVLDAAGRTVLQTVSQSHVGVAKLNVAALPTGEYFLRVTQGHHTYTGKLSIRK